MIDRSVLLSPSHTNTSQDLLGTVPVCVEIQTAMDVVHHFFTKQLPRYFLDLPLPRTFAGFLELSGKEWLDLLPLIGFVTLLLMMIIGQFFESKPAPEKKSESKSKDTVVNPSIDKEKEKIATSCDIEDLGKKTVFCRCWRSKKVSKQSARSLIACSRSSFFADVGFSSQMLPVGLSWMGFQL